MQWAAIHHERSQTERALNLLALTYDVRQRCSLRWDCLCREVGMCGVWTCRSCKLCRERVHHQYEELEERKCGAAVRVLQVSRKKRKEAGSSVQAGQARLTMFARIPARIQASVSQTSPDSFKIFGGLRSGQTAW